jgi:hypothetical protein
MSEAPQLLNLSETAQLAFPKTPVAMAVLAYADPECLERSIAQAQKDNEALELLRYSADRVFKIAKQRSSESPSLFNLPFVEQVAIDSESLHTRYQRSVKLANEASALRNKLAKPMRVANILKSSILGAGIVIIEYAEHHNHEVLIDYEIKGIAFGLLGAVAGYYGGKRHIGSAAKKKAHTIATRMNTVEELPVYFPPEEETEENRVGTVKVTGSEAGKLVEATFLDETFKPPKTVRKGILLDRRARRAARRTTQAMAHRAEAQLGYSRAGEQFENPTV